MKLSNPQIRLVQLAAFILTAILPSIALADVDDDRGKRIYPDFTDTFMM